MPVILITLSNSPYNASTVLATTLIDEISEVVKLLTRLKLAMRALT